MSDIQDILKTAIANGVVDMSRAAFLLCQASTEIERLRADAMQVDPLLTEVRELRRDNEWLRAEVAHLKNVINKDWAVKLYDCREDTERLRGLLREAREFITTDNGDSGCPPGECGECEMTRLAIRIDAALGAADQPAAVRDPDEAARAAFYRTREAQGFQRPEWDELAEETRQVYRDWVARRTADNSPAFEQSWEYGGSDLKLNKP